MIPATDQEIEEIRKETETASIEAIRGWADERSRTISMTDAETILRRQIWESLCEAERRGGAPIPKLLARIEALKAEVESERRESGRWRWVPEILAGQKFDNPIYARNFLANEFIRYRDRIETLKKVIESTKTAFRSLFAVAETAHLALPKAKIVSMGLSDFRALQELGKAINHCNTVAAEIDEALRE